ncbi:hypothetical protein [Rheinheimera hassiensis]|uniref:hypothetical protein n=1 Tax=Rheinheimera hassiensis TaxID=1193627 RepID=UPI001F05493F|nr:hypothetical protein [Rheinheimera hassiensis]
MSDLTTQLLLEIRRLVSINRLLSISNSATLNELTILANNPEATLVELRNKVISEVGVTMEIINLANCTLRVGLGRKRELTVKDALNRIGVRGVRSAIILYKLQMLRTHVSANWLREYQSNTEALLSIVTASYLMSKELGLSQEDVELTMSLSIFYSVSVFAKIIAACSLQIPCTQLAISSIRNPGAQVSSIILFVNNVHHGMVTLVEQMDNARNTHVPSLVAKAAWDLMLNNKKVVDIEGHPFLRNEVLPKWQ